MLCRIAQHLTKHFNKKISKNRLTCLHKDDNIFLAESTWRDVRVVEGARLERVYRGNSIVGSNPTLSAIAVLDGESAVPCNLQSAIAGLNSSPRL